MRDYHSSTPWGESSFAAKYSDIIGKRPNRVLNPRGFSKPSPATKEETIR